MPLLRGSSKAVLDVLRSSPQGVAEALRLIGSSTPAAQQPAAAPAAKPPAPGTAGPAPPPANPNVMEVFVNDVPVTVPKNYSVLQACEAAGIDIPRCVAAARLRPRDRCFMSPSNRLPWVRAPHAGSATTRGSR